MLCVCKKEKARKRMSWFVLYIKPRNEKKVTEQLQQLNIEVYCPLVTQIRQWSDRKKKVTVPLIPSYVFVQLEEKDRDLVFQATGVVRYLFWLGKPAIVRDAEIEILKKWLQSDLEDAQISSVQPGDKMAITKGLFKGKEGIVQEVTKNRLQLLLLELGIKITLTKQKVV